MWELSTYAFINAKIRAMLSFLIAPALFSRILEAEDVYKVMEILKEAPYYKGAIENIAKDVIDLRVIEKQLIKNDIDIYRRIYRSMSSDAEREFVTFFIERYELEQLKAVLRIWHKKTPVNIEDFILGEKISFAIDYKKIIYAPNIEEIIFLLEDTPYRKSILNARDRFKEKGSIFYLEANVDAEYYRRLILCIDSLSSRDKEVAKKIIGVEIDIKNIMWLIRMRKYYNLSVGDMVEWVIPGGSRINRENVTEFYAIDSFSKVADSVSFGPYSRVRELIEENMSLIENFLHEILLKEVKKALSGYPFTIGTILSYLILKNSETKNVVSLLYAKNLGLKKEEISLLLNI